MSDDQQTLAELRVDRLKRRIGNAFTLHADFKIAPGERVALVGRSGSGKTSLLRAIVGLDEISRVTDSGQIFLGQKEITTEIPQRREAGFVFQEPALFPALTVLENACFGLKVRGVSRAERETLGMDWLGRVGLKAQATRLVGKLSGGERQRVAFVRSLIFKPKFLLLDEPFSALDHELRNVLRQELVALHALWPAPLLFVTHEETDLKTVATRSLEIFSEPGSDIRLVRSRP